MACVMKLTGNTILVTGGGSGSDAAWPNHSISWSRRLGGGHHHEPARSGPSDRRTPPFPAESGTSRHHQRLLRAGLRAAAHYAHLQRDESGAALLHALSPTQLA